MRSGLLAQDTFYDMCELFTVFSRIYWCLVRRLWGEDLWNVRTGTGTVLDMSPGGTFFLSAYQRVGPVEHPVCAGVKPKISAIICQSEGAEVDFRNMFCSKSVGHSSGSVNCFKVNDISDKKAWRSPKRSVLVAAPRKHWDLCVGL